MKHLPPVKPKLLPVLKFDSSNMPILIFKNADLLSNTYQMLGQINPKIKIAQKFTSLIFQVFQS